MGINVSSATRVGRTELPAIGTSFGKTIRAIYDLLTANPNTELQIGDVFLRVVDGQLCIYDNFGNPKKIDDLRTALQNVCDVSQRSRDDLLGIIQNLNSPEFKGNINNQRVNLETLCRSERSITDDLNNNEGLTPLGAADAPPPPPSPVYPPTSPNVSLWNSTMLRLLDQTTRDRLFSDATDSDGLTDTEFKNFLGLSADAKLTAEQTQLLKILQDGKISVEEMAELKKLGISDELFRVITNRMNADGQLNDSITIEELFIAAKTINDYADAAGLQFGQAVDLYLNTTAFHNDNIGRIKTEMQAARTAIAGQLPRAELRRLIAATSNDERAKIIKKISELTGFSETVLIAALRTITLSDYTNNEEALANILAQRLANLPLFTLAVKKANGADSVTKIAQIFGFEEADLQGLSDFPSEARLNRSNIVRWLRGRTVLAAGGADDVSPQEYQRAIDKLRMAIGSADPQAAIEACLQEYSFLANRSDAIELIVTGYYLKNPSLENLRLALDLVDNLEPDDSTACSLRFRLGLAAATLGGEQGRALLTYILNSIPVGARFTFDRENIANIQSAFPFLQYLPANMSGMVVRMALALMIGDEAYINNADNAGTGIDKAQILYLRGMHLYHQAGANSKKKAFDLLAEAARAAQDCEGPAAQHIITMCEYYMQEILQRFNSVAQNLNVGATKPHNDTKKLVADMAKTFKEIFGYDGVQGGTGGSGGGGSVADPSDSQVTDYLASSDGQGKDRESVKKKIKTAGQAARQYAENTIKKKPKEERASLINTYINTQPAPIQPYIRGILESNSQGD